MKILRTVIFIFFVFCFLPQAFCAGVKTRVLFIGNSLTFSNALPQVVQAMAQTRNHDMEFDMYAPAGYRLAQHIQDAPLLAKIKNGPWDYVVLQEQGQMLALGKDIIAREVEPYAKFLCQTIRQFNPNGKIVFYVTPAPKGLEPGVQYTINENYIALAKGNQAMIAPVGQAWAEALTRFADTQMYSDDIHPNINGTYLAACVFYSVFFHETASGLIREKNIDPAMAIAFQAIADKAMSSAY